jgi:phage shock protein A
MSDELHRDIGRHDEAIETLKSEVAAMRAQLNRIESTLSQTKGGVRTLIAVGSIAGAVGAAIAKGYAMLKAGVS